MKAGEFVSGGMSHWQNSIRFWWLSWSRSGSRNL